MVLRASPLATRKSGPARAGLGLGSIRGPAGWSGLDSLQDLHHDAGTDGLATFADGEPEAILHGDRRVQLDGHLDIITGHAHLGLAAVFRQQVEDRAGHVGGADVELGTVALEERGMTTPFFLAQDVDLGLELGVRRDRAGLANDLPAFEIVFLHTAEQDTDVVTCHALVERLLEHLDPRDRRGLLGAEADDLDGVADLDLAALDPAGSDCASALDREHVLDRHQERLVDLADGVGDVLVHRLDQVKDGLGCRGVLGVFQGRPAAAADDRNLVAGELVVCQQFPQLELDQLEQLLVVHEVDLVEKDNERGHADLAGQKDMLPRLGHWTVRRGDHQDRAVHLGGASDHVLDVVSVARAVDVGVMPLIALVLHVRDGDGHGLGLAVLGQHREDRRGQRRLAVVNVPDGAHVDVWLRSGESFLGHVQLRLYGIPEVEVNTAGTLPAAPPASTVQFGRPSQRPGPTARHVTCHARSLGNRPKSCRWDLNPGPRPYQGRALPTEPRQQNSSLYGVAHLPRPPLSP